MTSSEKWNLIVSIVNKKTTDKESEIQRLWENIFADVNLFGYSKLGKDIDGMRNIHIGSHIRTIPDIIIRNQNKDLFVVELKQHNMPFNDRFKEQLFSYMRLLSLKIGILICEKIFIYVFDDSGKEISMVIDFTNDNFKGGKFVELFGKKSFEENAVREFVKMDAHIKEIRDDIQRLDFVEVLKKYYGDKYSNEEIALALNGLQVCVSIDNTAGTVTPLPSGYNEFIIKYGNSPKSINQIKIQAGSPCILVFNNDLCVGVVWSHYESRGSEANGQAEIRFFENYRNRYGLWHRMFVNEQRLSFKRLQNELFNNSEFSYCANLRGH